MAGRSGQYYRAGHWVNRSAGGSKGKVGKKSTAVVVGGLLVVGAWMGLFSHGSDAQNSTNQPSSPTSSASAGR